MLSTDSAVTTTISLPEETTALPTATTVSIVSTDLPIAPQMLGMLMYRCVLLFPIHKQAC